MSAPWTTVPTAPPAPEALGWSVSPPTEAAFNPGLGWQAAYQRVGATISQGTLSAVISSTRLANQPVHLSADGALSATTAKVGYRFASTLGSEGILWGQIIYPVFSVAVALSGGGLFDIIGTDGIAGDIDSYSYTSGAVPVNVNFSGGGQFGGQLGDGLTAVTSQSFTDGIINFSGVGTLSATAGPVVAADGELSGAGSLSAVTEQIYAVPVGFSSDGAFNGLWGEVEPVYFTGAGSLFATAYQFVNAGTVPLSGDGLLGLLPYAAISVDLAGGGTLSAVGAENGVDGLTATTIEQFPEADNTGGTGTISALISQIYAITGALSGSGALSATVKPIVPASAALSGAGSLTATAYQFDNAGTVPLAGAGTLVASTTPKFLVPASFSSSGSLSGSGFEQYDSAAALSGDGALTATAQKAIAYSATGSGFTATKSGSGSFTITTKAGDYVIVDLSGETSSSETNILSFAGTQMTLLASQPFDNNTSNAALKRYGIFDSTGGTNRSISYSGSHPNDITGNAVAYSNVTTVGTTTTTYGASGAASASQSTTADPGQMIVQGFGADQCSSALWTPSGGTSRYNNDAATSGSNYLTPLNISDAGGTGSSQTFSVSDTNVGNYAGISTVLT